MKAQTILVTGSNGQLGQELQHLSDQHNEDQWIFASSKELDITSQESVNNYLTKHNPDVIINCAAYTKVDLAESDDKQAYAVNESGVRNLVDAMKGDCILVHYSTDYVYQSSGTAIKENESTNPVNVYAASKLAGDLVALQSNKKTIVIRTSWVYSSYGNNFVKTMLRLADTRDQLSVVNDQIGSPTYAADLAVASLQIVSHLVDSDVSDDVFNKVYHYSNQGQISWYDFAKEIFHQTGKNLNLSGIPTKDYPTPAKRPSWSVLDCKLISDTFNIQIADWKDSLSRCIKKLQND